MQVKGSTLPLKPKPLAKAEITRSQKQDYQWQKDFYLPISFFFKEQVVLQVEGHTVIVWEREPTDKAILRTII